MSVATKSQILKFRELVRQSTTPKPALKFLKDNNIAYIDCNSQIDGFYSCLHDWTSYVAKYSTPQEFQEQDRLFDQLYQVIKKGGGVTYEHAVEPNYAMFYATTTTTNIWTRHLLQETCLDQAWNTSSKYDKPTPLLRFISFFTNITNEHGKHEHDTNVSAIVPKMSRYYLNLPDTHGDTALFKTILKGYTKTLRALLSHPALELEHNNEFPEKSVAYAMCNSSNGDAILAVFKEFYIPRIINGFGYSIHCPLPLVSIMFTYLYC